MGYYTKFTIEAPQEVLLALEELSGYGYLSDEGFVEGKWYKHREHCKQVSQQFSDVLITVHGEGEEAEDLWVAYYLNEKEQMEKAIISYADFDSSKLK